MADMGSPVWYLSCIYIYTRGRAGYERKEEEGGRGGKEGGAGGVDIF